MSVTTVTNHEIDKISTTFFEKYSEESVANIQTSKEC
jgi:hypothetical protein